MQHGDTIKTIPKIEHDISNSSPGIDIELVNKTIEHINKKIINRRVPYYLYLQPGLQYFSEELGESPEKVFTALNYLVSYYSEYIKLQAILDITDEGIFYILQDEDIELLNEKNILHNPDDPRTIYKDAEKMIRRAYVLGS